MASIAIEGAWIGEYDEDRRKSKRPAGRFSRWSLFTASATVEKRWKIKRDGVNDTRAPEPRVTRRHKGEKRDRLQVA